MTELPPIRISTEEFEGIEARMKSLFKREVYMPILKELQLSGKVIHNAMDFLLEAIRSGRLTYNKGKFSGRLSSTLTKELKSIGAKWDKKGKCFSIPLSEMPMDVRNTVSASESRFTEKMEAIDRKLAAIVPEELAKQLKVKDLFDRSIWKVEKQFQKNVDNITIAPKLTERQAARIAAEWQDNMDLWVKDFTQKEIQSLRYKIRQSVFAGNRYESAVKSIQESYGVTERKAKFLARQETNLLITKFQEVRYQESGINEYKWRCVAGTKLHPVRPRHKALNDASLAGKTFRFDDPPVTSEPGEAARRNNPGQDYNCRCTAIPVVKFK